MTLYIAASTNPTLLIIIGVTFDPSAQLTFTSAQVTVITSACETCALMSPVLTSHHLRIIETSRNFIVGKDVSCN